MTDPEFTTVITYPDNFCHAAVNGAYIGPAGPSSLFVELYFERARLLGEEIRKTPPNPTSPSEGVIKPFRQINEKLFVSGCLVELSTAKMIHALLGQQIALCESRLGIREEPQKALSGIPGHGGYL